MAACRTFDDETARPPASLAKRTVRVGTYTKAVQLTTHRQSVRLMRFVAWSGGGHDNRPCMKRSVSALRQP